MHPKNLDENRTVYSIGKLAILLNVTLALALSLQGKCCVVQGFERQRYLYLSYRQETEKVKRA